MYPNFLLNLYRYVIYTSVNNAVLWDLHMLTSTYFIQKLLSINELNQLPVGH